MLSSGCWVRAGGGACLYPSSFGQARKVSHRFRIELSLSRYSRGKQEGESGEDGCLLPSPSRRPDGAGMLSGGKRSLHAPALSCISSGAG